MPEVKGIRNYKTSKSLLKITGTLFLIILLATSIFFSQKNLESLQVDRDNKDAFIYVPSGRFLKVTSLGFEQMLSDLYWLKAIQHIGDRVWAKRGFPYLYPLVSLVTDLDPEFAYAYEVAGVVLSMYADRIDESIAILEKGYKQDLDYWQIPFYLGFDYFYYLEDYEKAAFYMAGAAEISGRPAFVPRLAARLYAEAGNPDTAIDFLESVYKTTDDENIKKGLEDRIKLARMEKDIQFLEEAYRIFNERFDRPPRRLDEMVKGSIIDRVPDEPYGGYYYIDPETGEIKNSSGKERFKTYKK